MSQQLTLFALLKYKKEKQEDEKEIDCPVANPLDLKFNSLVNIKTLKYQDCDFKLEAIEEYNRFADGQTFTFTDYILKDRSESISYPLKLRLVDTDVLVLWNYLSMAYDPELDKILKETATTKIFAINEDDKEIIYYRANDIKEPWNAKVKKLIDADGNGKITRTDPTTRKTIDYWDFWREEEKDLIEMLFVEMNTDTGWVDMWCGTFVDSESIIII